MNKLPILLLVLCAPLARAESEGSAAGGRVGDDTRVWLQLQGSGIAAAPERPMSGEVADKVYQRYVNSFGRPIPEHFQRESAVAGGSSGN